MKFFIINSLRTVVYVAYFAIIAAYVFGSFLRRGDLSLIFEDLFGRRLAPAGEVAVSLGVGLFAGWLAATIICGLIVTLLDIRDDINDRLPDQRK
ncbi:MAG: hypothetical protein AAF719_08550 [Pseudomonadota bacterium]